MTADARPIDQKAIAAAFDEAITLARQVKYLPDQAAAVERFAREGGRIMAQAGLTMEEGWIYLTRIYAAVAGERSA